MTQSAGSERSQSLTTTFQRQDVGVLVKTFQTRNELSPFVDEAPTDGKPSAGMAAFMQQPFATDVIQLLCNPDVQILHRLAEADTGLTTFSAYLSAKHGLDLIVALYPLPDAEFMIRVFRGADDYSLWLAGVLGTKTGNAAENLLPKPLSVEALVYAFHTIDSYRRVHYQAALDFRTDISNQIPAADFQESLAKSLAAENYTWLLSSFVRATPELTRCEFNLEEKDLSSLMELQLLGMGGNGSKKFVFGENALKLGTEFKSGFDYSLGIAAIVRAKNGLAVRSRYFVAPSQWTNHIIEIRPSKPKWMAKHWTLDFHALAQFFNSVLPQALQAVGGDAPPEAAVATADTRPRVEPKTASAASPAAFGQNVEPKVPAAAAAAPKASDSEAAWRKLTKEYAENCARLLAQNSPEKYAELGELVQLRDRAGNYWRVSLRNTQWFTVQQNQWVQAAPPSEFWIEDSRFQKLRQVLNQVSSPGSR